MGLIEKRIGIMILCGSLSATAPLFSQTFIEEGLQRGFDVVVNSTDLGGPGISAMDFDQDGDDDLTVGFNGFIQFYENINGQFQILDLDLSAPSGDVKAVIWSDIDNDNHLDLLITSYLGGVKLYKGLGDMEFEDITENCGLSTDIAGNWGASFCDVNRDGFVDLQLTRSHHWINPPDNPTTEPHKWSRLYLNNGDATFNDVTISNGFVIDPSPVFMGVFFDFDNDLWPDNITIIDKNPGNRLFVNNGGEFTESAVEYGIHLPFNDIMSNSIADFDNDGYLDVFMTNSGGLDMPSYLMKNFQGQTFADVAIDVNVQGLEFGWGAVWIDANNNGWQDLFYSTSTAIENHFYLNNGGVFTLAYNELGVTEQVNSYSAAKGDFDNDGCYDLVVQSRTPTRSQLLMNQGISNHSIKITPHGTVSNSMATGSWIKLYENGNQYVHFTMCGVGYLAQHSQHLIFGLNQSTQVDSLKIQYPSGHTDVYFYLQADTSYQFFEGETFTPQVSASPQAICENDEVILDGGDHETHSWSTGESTRYITVSEPGNYSVEVTNEFGISATAVYELEILSNPLISTSLSPNPCLGDSLASIEIDNLNGVEADSVFWDNGMTGVFIDSLVAGTYSYVFVDINGCSSSGFVEVIDPEELFIFPSVTPEDPGAGNGSITLSIFGGAPPYLVLLEEDTMSTVIENLEAGDYSLTIMDSFGCSETVEVTINSTLGLRGTQANMITIFPNPTSDKIDIRGAESIRSVLIYSSNGVLMEEIFPQSNSIAVDRFSPGIYFIVIEFGNGQKGYSSFVKN